MGLKTKRVEYLLSDHYGLLSDYTLGTVLVNIKNPAVNFDRGEACPLHASGLGASSLGMLHS